MQQITKNITVTKSHVTSIPQDFQIGDYVEVIFTKLEVIKPGTTDTPS